MRIAIVGAGAIGGYLGVELALSGHDVRFIARGPNLAALRDRGMRLKREDGTWVSASAVRAVGSMSEAGPQDVVLLTLKAHQVGAVAADLHHLCHDTTVIVTMQNGIPWWYFHRLPGPFEGHRIESADPGGTIERYIDPSRVIGSVVYPAAVLTAPGVVEVVEGNRFGLGELDGSMSERVQSLAQAFIKAGFRAPVTRDIRAEIWLKLWGNLSFNPVSALTHATLEDICRFPPTRSLVADMMAEAETIANKLGVTFKLGVERRIAGAEKVGAHKTSMLQDIELGRPIEHEALIGAIIELGALTQTSTPTIATVYALLQLLTATLDKTKGRLEIQALPSR
jgi:2-dehydropantoate 2-reductase